MGVDDGLATLRFASPSAWEAWLEENHAASAGVWIEMAKKDSGIESVRYPEVLESALCFGWIDGRRNALDASYFLQRFTPRRAQSRWSRINRDTAERLIAAGRMRPAGLGEVERAKADGRWAAAYDSQRTATIPDDLTAALEANPAAGTFFQSLNSASRYAILYRIADAKRPATRAQRIEKFVEMLARGEAPHLFGGPAPPGSSTGPSPA
jgi:uncharacterized protein YdeI (YjbR/CyaY-like superfamily)